MKRIVLTAGLCIAVSAIFSQQQYNKNIIGDSIFTVRIKSEPRFYVNVHTGYSMALGSTFKFYPDDVSSIVMKMVDNNVISKDVAYSAPRRGLGEGLRVGAGLSYVLNDFINIGLDIDYFKSTIRKIRDSSFNQLYTTGTIAEYSYSERYTISYDATLLTFTPNITLKAISRPKWFLYNKIGAVITIRPNSIEHDTRRSNATTSWQGGFKKDSAGYTDTRYEWGIKNPSLGFSGALGAQVKITEKIRVFGEVQFSHIVFVVNRRKTTNYNVDGMGNDKQPYGE